MSLANSALSRPRGAFMSMSSTTADWRRLANFNRLTSRLFSRSIASRSTMSASRSSKPSAARSGCWRCSSSALAMPVSPSATRRSCVGCVSIVSPFVFLLTRGVRSPASSASVVVATTTDFGVLDRRAIRRFRVDVGFVEPGLEDGRDRSVGGRADIVAALACRLDAGGAVGLHQAHDAQTRSEALLGMGLRLHDGLDHRDGRRTDLGGLPHHALRRPFGVAAVRARHVLGYGCATSPDRCAPQTNLPPPGNNRRSRSASSIRGTAKQTVYGARMQDLRVQSSGYGSVIP